MNKEEYFKTWSEKLSKPVEEINKEYEEKLKSSNNPDTALRELYLEYKKQLRSPAIGFEGVIIGASSPIDIVAKQRTQATELFKTNPQQAIEQGICDDEGNPLDTRESWNDGRPNQNYRKPLPQHNWLRTIYGICKQQDSYKPFIMNLNGDVATQGIPLNKPCKFRANDRSDKSNSPGLMLLSSSVTTRFEVVEEEINIKELIDNFYSDMKVEFNSLQTYHNQNKDNYNRFCLVEGYVSSLNTELTAFGSRILVLEDEELDINSQSLTCWVPENIELDFEEGSKVLVCGRTSQKDEEDSDLMMNVYGVICLERPPQTTEEPTTVTQEKSGEDW